MLLFNYYFEFPEIFPSLQFTSIYFLLFLLAVSVALFFIKHHFIRNIIILIANLFFIWTFSQNFYYVIVACFYCAYGYIASIIINRYYRNKILLLILDIIPIIALIYFKTVLLPTYSIVVPLGISFYLLRLIWYLNYVCYGKIELQKNIIYFSNYLLFFPSFISGPIENPKHFIEQIKKDEYISYSSLSKGWMRLLYGVFEKVVICDYFGLIVNRLLENAEVSGFGVLVGIFLYSFQIYLDFDSYSNIAIGSASLFNIDLNENFKSPYLAVNIKDFWSRWHISLSTWLKENIYIPLGGNRFGDLRKAINILIVFIVSGLWHDFAIHYLIWGIMHALLRIAEDFIESKINKNILNNFFIKLIRICINFIIVTFVWLIFKYDSFSSIFNVLGRLFTPTNLSLVELLTNHELIWLEILIVFVVVLDIIKNKINILRYLGHPANVLRFAFYLVFIVIFLIFGIYGGSFEATDFIYRWF